MLNYDGLDNNEKKKIGGIYKKYESFFLRCAVGILKNQTMAEDAIHNAFISLMEHKNVLNSLSEEELLKWCVVILKNKCIDQLRKQKHLSAVSIDDIAFTVSADEIDMESKLIRDETRDSLNKYLESLDMISRQILDMKYVLGMSYGEIAQELGVTTKYVDNKLMSAKSKIRIFFESEANLRNEKQ